MSEYKLELKQIVDYPRCRVYRKFVQSLIGDKNIRTNGQTHLYYYTVLCSYANFRTSYRHLDGTSYTIRPGEWLCKVSELANWFRLRFQKQVITVLDALQKLHLITYSRFGHGQLIKYRIIGWRKHNTVLDYNCPCQKASGFFFMPVKVAAKLIKGGRASEMDIVLDLWFSAIYNDRQVLGSGVGPVVYYRNGTGCPILSYADLAQRWGRSRSSVGRLLKKLTDKGYLSLITFPGRIGSVIYLNNYLSTMFQISDVMVDKDEVAISLNITIHTPENFSWGEMALFTEETLCVSEQLASVPKPHIEAISANVAQLLAAQGIFCFQCRASRIKLYPLSGSCQEIELPDKNRSPDLRMGLTISCGKEHPIYTFELILRRLTDNLKKGGR